MSSLQIPFKDRLHKCKGKSYVSTEFYFYILDMADELIEEQREEIIKLKQKVNKLEQKRK